MKNKMQTYEKIITLLKELDVITIRDVERNLKIHYQTAVRSLLEMEIEGILKHRIIMRRKNKEYKVWILNK